MEKLTFWLWERPWWLALFLLVGFGAALLALEAHGPPALRPCSDFADYSREAAPARCFKDFDAKRP